MCYGEGEREQKKDRHSDETNQTGCATANPFDLFQAGFWVKANGFERISKPDINSTGRISNEINQFII